MTNNYLTQGELKAIASNLVSLNAVMSDNNLADIIMEFPDKFVYSNPNTGDMVGHAIFDGEIEEWVFEPAGKDDK
jgi:hypothetical protein